jgi:RNA polymerase sigma-70 factor (ECF subfamily)
MTDNQAIELAKNNREEGFKAIFTNHADYLFTHARRFLKNNEAAEDLTQETFKDAFRFLAGFKGNSSLRTWLYKIMFNRALKQLKKPENPGLKVAPASVVNSFKKIERRLDVTEVLNLLPAKERSILLLAYWDELKLNEIADILGISLTNAKVSLFRARQKFAGEWNKINQKGERINEM